MNVYNLWNPSKLSLTYPKNSKQLVDVLNSRRHARGLKFAKIELDDFYIRGDQDDLIRAAVSTADLDEPRKISTFRRVVRFILFHQYVTFRGQVDRVQKGSGMGKRHSSAVSSSGFLDLVEKRVCAYSRIQSEAQNSGLPA